MQESQASGLDEANRDELYQLARDVGIDGRSKMNKDELLEALRERQSGASRLGQFQRLAHQVAGGEFRMLPRHLTGNDRRLHLRQTIREDNGTRIAANAEDVSEKFGKLASSMFSFFRGTALLFYRDLAGEDAWMPTVLALGDVHPENFGVMPNADNIPIFGVNDFDEACYAPFTWDLKRGAVGFMLAAAEEAGAKPKRQRKYVRRFVRGYIEGTRHFARHETENDHQVRHDNAPKLIRKLIEDAWEDREEWLADDYLDEFKRGFRSDKELVPISSRTPEFQQLLERLVSENDIKVPPRAGELKVKDVAIRRGQGTASLGLPRYYLLVEGPRKDGSDDLIIELKKARRSALAGLAPPSDYDNSGSGERIVHAQTVQLVRGDVFYGHVEIDGESFMSRERAPFRDDIDLDDLSHSQWKKYARICGRALAHAHAMSDEQGALEDDLEPLILEAIGEPRLFVDDIVRFASEAAERVRQDFRFYKEDHRLNAFRRTDQVFR